MATYDLSPSENDFTSTWLLQWATERFKKQSTNIWSRETLDWLDPSKIAKGARDGDDGAPSHVLADLSHNLGSYEVKPDPR